MLLIVDLLIKGEMQDADNYLRGCSYKNKCGTIEC